MRTRNADLHNLKFHSVNLKLYKSPNDTAHRSSSLVLPYFYNDYKLIFLDAIYTCAHVYVYFIILLMVTNHDNNNSSRSLSFSTGSN